MIAAFSRNGATPRRKTSRQIFVIFGGTRFGFLCAASVFSVPLWLLYCTFLQPQRHREHRGCTEKNSDQPAAIFAFSFSTRTRRRIFPDGDFGILSTNSR